MPAAVLPTIRPMSAGAMPACSASSSSGSAAEAASRRLLAGRVKALSPVVRAASAMRRSASAKSLSGTRTSLGASCAQRSSADASCRSVSSQELPSAESSRARRMTTAGRRGFLAPAILESWSGERSALSTGRKRHTKIHRSHRRIILGGVTESAHSGCCRHLITLYPCSFRGRSPSRTALLDAHRGR